MLQRLLSFLSPAPAGQAVMALYHAIVAQARRPEFYQDLDVPDTLDGRFDLLLLHMILVLRRLRDAGKVRQDLFDLMFADMDRSLREIGVGDMSISKKMKPMFAAFYGRAHAYEEALAGDKTMLAAAMQRNLYRATAAVNDLPGKMAAYAQRVETMLACQPVEAIVAGQIAFAAPLA